MRIIPYCSQYWEDIKKVHDTARMQELILAGLEDAFLPLAIAAEREDLFDYNLYIAVKKDIAVGFVAFTEGELAWLYVHPDFQQQGFGRALAEFAIGKMTEEDKCVEVLCGNEPARSLYRSLGFTEETLVHGKMPGNESFSVSVWQMKVGK